MLKYIVAGALVVSFAAPAFAADYYVALRNGGGCVMTTTAPTGHYKVMGVYSTKRQAKMAMHGMMACR
jgi:hypothetical protein